MLFVDEFCGILVYIKFGADVTSQYINEKESREKIQLLLALSYTYFHFTLILLNGFKSQLYCSFVPLENYFQR